MNHELYRSLPQRTSSNPSQRVSWHRFHSRIRAILSDRLFFCPAWRPILRRKLSATPPRKPKDSQSRRSAISLCDTNLKNDYHINAVDIIISALAKLFLYITVHECLDSLEPYRLSSRILSGYLSGCLYRRQPGCLWSREAKEQEI